MRSDAVFKFENTFDVSIPVSSQDPVTGQIISTYQPYSTGNKGMIIPGSQGNIYLGTRDGLPQYARISSVRDRNGVSPFSIDGNEYDMFVLDAAPSYDALGTIVGWRHLLRRTLPAGVVASHG